MTLQTDLMSDPKVHGTLRHQVHSHWVTVHTAIIGTMLSQTPCSHTEESCGHISRFSMGASGSSSSRFDIDQLPEGVLYEILLRVPDMDLITSCRLVCKHWKEFIDSHSLWKEKAERKGRVIPRCLKVREVLPKHIYRNICLWNPFGKNLIRNPYGKETISEWSSCRGKWVIEDPPIGADSLDTVPELNGCSSCFATTHSLCSKQQRIDLYQEGCSAEIMAEIEPEIYVCEWYAARFDCGSVYRLKVELEDNKTRVLDRFTFKHVEPQWTGSRWSKVEHTFPKQSKPVRYVRFCHEGQDTQFWAGNYGSKMTGATVKLITLG